MGEQRIQALAVLARGAEPGAVHGADHQGRARVAAEHVAELGGLVEDLIEADADEIDEHKLRHGAQPGRSRTRRGTDIGTFAQRRIDDAIAAELAEQPLGDAEHAAPRILLAWCARAAGDVLAHQDDCRIPAHFLAQRLVDRRAIAFLAHATFLLQ